MCSHEVEVIGVVDQDVIPRLFRQLGAILWSPYIASCTSPLCSHEDEVIGVVDQDVIPRLFRQPDHLTLQVVRHHEDDGQDVIPRLFLQLGSIL